VQESASLTHVGADGIKISTGGGQVANVKIELADEQNLQAMRQAKEKESEATRAQNALPSWIAKSTVSGAQNGAGTKDALGDTIMEAQNGSSSPMKEVSDGVHLHHFSNGVVLILSCRRRTRGILCKTAK